MTPITIAIDQLRLDHEVWPRFGGSDERVEAFKELLLAGESLPPIEVVIQDQKYLIADGAHRAAAAEQVGLGEVLAVVIEPQPDETPALCAHRRALETATRSALPLTRAERRKAVRRLAETRPDLSRRAIAQLVGVAHSTVDRWVEERAPEGEGSPGPSFLSADQAARRLATYLSKLNESRDLADYLAPARMGRHLAQAFEDVHGTNALKRARVFAKWTAAAVQVLEGT